MKPRRRISETERLRIFISADGLCHLCGGKIDGQRERWDVEHVVPLELGGGDAPGSDNLKPAHEACHRGKTRTDKGRIAKAQRQERRSLGIRRTVKSPLPGGRKSKWKKKVSGEVTLREDET